MFAHQNGPDEALLNILNTHFTAGSKLTWQSKKSWKDDEIVYYCTGSWSEIGSCDTVLRKEGFDTHGGWCTTNNFDGTGYSVS